MIEWACRDDGRKAHPENGGRAMTWPLGIEFASCAPRETLIKVEVLVASVSAV